MRLTLEIVETIRMTYQILHNSTNRWVLVHPKNRVFCQAECFFGSGHQDIDPMAATCIDGVAHCEVEEIQENKTERKELKEGIR